MSCLELQLIQLRQGQGSTPMDTGLIPALFPEQPVGWEDPSNSVCRRRGREGGRVGRKKERRWLQNAVGGSGQLQRTALSLWASSSHNPSWASPCLLWSGPQQNKSLPHGSGFLESQAARRNIFAHFPVEMLPGWWSGTLSGPGRKKGHSAL